MTHVHYKFSSKLSYDTVLLDGPRITLRDLKRQIMGREKLRAGDCDLQITNAQTKEEYTDDEGLIPKGSSVIVRRIPIIGVKSGSSKNHNIERSDNQHHHAAYGAVKAMDDHNSSRSFFSKMADLAHTDASEDDKIKAMMNQSAYDSMGYTKKFGAVLPANYTCYRCGNTGHHIRNCPTSAQDKNFEAPMRIKKSTGIPRSFMVEVDDPSIKGAMLTNCGRYAIPTIDAAAYAIGKKEKPPFVPQEPPKIEVEDNPVPDELLCLICHDLLSDAVVIPCCGNSYCDDCIRSALLDSEEHICPTCSQPDVSPDTLIANKFLRQAVNNYRKEIGQARNLRVMSGTSQSLNPTPTPSPVPTPPPIASHSQPQKPYQSTHSQQDPLLPCPQPADTPPVCQVSEPPPAATSPTSPSSLPSTSLQPVESHLEISDKEAEGTCDDSVPAASLLVSNKDPAAAAAAAAPSQLIPLVNHTPAADQLPSVNPPQSSSAPRPSGPSTCWDSPSSSSSCPPGGWTESNAQQLPHPSSSSSSSSSTSLYPATPPPPLFPSPHFHTFLSAQQPLGGFPPGYPPATPLWTLPNPQGSPIPSLCSSTSSIPALIPKEWFSNQRRKKERSPHRGSTYRRSSSRSNSKPSKSKSSRSYSRSSSRSRSRSRSRSQGSSRPRSPYSRVRDLHTRPSHSYSYGYKRSRSPTPSSSSSPQVCRRSRSKSPSDHWKTRHSRKSASGGYGSRRGGGGGGEHPSSSGLSQRETGDPWAARPYEQHDRHAAGLELDREFYLQRKREYKEWCDKYFSSYVSHFHQLPPSLLTLPPPPPNPQWGDRGGSGRLPQADLDSRYRPQGRRAAAARADGRSPPSQSSSDSRSPPSQSSSDSRSPPSQSSSDSRSPVSRPSSDTCSTPSEEGARRPRCDEDDRTPVAPRETSLEVKEQERSREKEQPVAVSSEDHGALKLAQKRTRKHEEAADAEESSSPDAADSTDERRNNKRRENTEPNTSINFTPARKETAESVHLPVKSEKPSDRDYERKSREQRDLEREKEWRRGRNSDSRQDLERHNERAGRADTDRHAKSRGRKSSDSRSEKKRKRKGEDTERNERERSPGGRSHSSKWPKTKLAEDPEPRKSESPKRFDRETLLKEKKREKKSWPLEESDIWEGEIKVKPQKKISININLDGKRKEEKQDTVYSEKIAEKPKEAAEKMDTGEEERLNRGETEIITNEKKESIKEQEGEEQIKPDEKETTEMCQKDAFGDEEKKMAGEGEDATEKKRDGGEENFNLWLDVLTGAGTVEEKEDGKREEVRRGVTTKEEEEEGERCDDRRQEIGESVSGTKTSPVAYKPTEEATDGGWRSQSSRNQNLSQPPNITEEDGSTSTVGSWAGDECTQRTVVKTVEENTQDTAEDREDKLVLIQVPHYKWMKEDREEEEQQGGALKAQTDTLPVAHPSPPVTQTNKDTEGEDEQKRQRSVETERDGEKAAVRGRDRERERNSSTPAGSARSVAPSSGRDGNDGGRERETQERKSQKESERPKERMREEGRGRDREREREHSSTLKRNLPSSTHHSSSSASHGTERRDRQRGGEEKNPSGPIASKGITSINTHKTHRDTLLDFKSKGKEEEQQDLVDHCRHNQKDSAQSCRSQDASAGSRHSPSSFSHSRGKEGDTLPSRSPGGQAESSKARTSSADTDLTRVAGFDQPDTRRPRSLHAASPAGPDVTGSSEREKEKGGGRRKESRGVEGQWKRYKLEKMMREREKETRGIQSEREQGRRWEVDNSEPKWGAGGELEEGERPSSSSSSSNSSSNSTSSSSRCSSSSQGNSEDDSRNNRKMKQTKHKKETIPAGPELEEGELTKHQKKSKKNKEGSDGEADNRWKEAENHAKLPFPVQKVPGFHF